MSIPVLTQVYDEVRRLAIAGSVVAGGDFRLKKLAPPLEQAGQKAPVFAKVAQSVTRLVESPEKSSAEALLELSTLVNAILYTQGETGEAGELAPIETTDLGQQHTQASARVLKPLLEALSTTGSGRLEIIKDSFERGAFKDLRLVKPALGALDDVYGDIGDFIAERVLPLYGKAILPELRARLDLKGRAGHGAGWFEGLAQRNRYALLARQPLWEQLADYIASLDDEQFRRALVFLRRAFGSFSPQEKRHIAENLGECWGLSADAASELIEQPLTEKEEEKLKDLNEFDFGDL